MLNEGREFGCRRLERCFDVVDDEREERDLSRFLYPDSRVHRSGYRGVEFPGDTPDSGHSPALDVLFGK